MCRPKRLATSLLFSALAAIFAAHPVPAASLIYSGVLETNGQPAQGRHDLRLSAYASAEGGLPQAAPIEFTAVELHDGRFEVELDLPGQAEEAWVELAVRPAGGAAFTPLVGRTKATLAPAAIGQCWSSVGDSGTSTAVNFLGTTDGQPLVLRANGGLLFNSTTLVSSNVDDVVFRPRAAPADEDLDLRFVTRGGKSATLFLAESNGGLGIGVPNLTAASQRLTVSGGVGGIASLSNGGAWTNASSRSFKEGFDAIKPLEVLQRLVSLPITTWTYTGSAEGLHMGPVAEDFKAAFGLAGDGKSIATVDADGVAMAAIQGLNAKLEAENAKLREQNQQLDSRMNELTERLQQLEIRLDGAQ